MKEKTTIKEWALLIMFSVIFLSVAGILYFAGYRAGQDNIKTRVYEALID